MQVLVRYCIILLLVCVTAAASGQYYLRGEVKTEQNTALQNARIFLHTAKANYYSGADGSFGIIMRQQEDTVTITLDGYEPQTLHVKAGIWQRITLKSIITKATKNKNKLISITMDKKQTHTAKWSVSDETYFQLVENEFVETAVYPNTGYSLNVNKASYSNVRRFINGSSEVPPDAVKIEEMVNYFNLMYTEPERGKTFAVTSTTSDCPWNTQDRLLYVNVCARKLSLDSIPPANFVFLIDVSGSMDDEKRLPLVQAAFQLFVKNIRPIDTVSIVTYGGGVRVWLQPTSGSEKSVISNAIEELLPNGDTPGEAALQTAYTLAQKTFIKGGNNRIILATDGDFNVGETGEKELEELVARYKNLGIYLTCLGVGTGNLKDSKLQVLAKKGNGNYAYLDDLNEAEKTLVQELTQTMYAVADNALLNVEFNPKVVGQYRLIGFDNRRTAMNEADYLLEGGEVGSGSSVLAIFQYTPQGTQNSTDELARLQIRYAVGKDTSAYRVSHTVNQSYIPFDTLEQPLQFATAVTAFGLKLKNSSYAKINWDQIMELSMYANKSQFLQNEFATLVEKAMYIYEPKRKKKAGKKKKP